MGRSCGKRGPAIVLASATIITGIMVLAWLAGLLGAVGLGFIALGLFFCVTIILFMPGLACIAVGALLKMAARRSKRG